MFSRPIQKAFLVACSLWIVALIGCGGGGSDGNPGTGNTGQPSPQAAAVAAAQGAQMFFGSGSMGTVVGRGSQSGFTNGYLRIAQRLFQSMAGSRATAGYIYDPASGLYFKVTSAGNDSAVEFLSTNGVVNDAGNITATLIFGGHGVFPSEVSLQFNVIYQGTTISGPMAITFYDGSLDNLRFQMNLASSRTGVSVASDLTASPTSVTGTVSISKGAISLTLTNISYTPGKFASDYSFGSIQGTLSVLSDGSGQVTAIANGTFTLTWNAALDARFTAPGGATVDLGYLPTL